MAASSSSKRLFVGNLADSIDEYTLVKLMSKHGKIAKLDFLFHKTGPHKGKPRGYAFVEYATAEEALKTMLELNDKLVQGRKLSIKQANEAPQYSSASGSGSGPWRNGAHAQRPTTLSILKGHRKPVSRDGKISALEAKLAAMEAEQAALLPPSASASADQSENEADPPQEASTSKLALPDNLPQKPSATAIAMGEKLEQEAEKQKEEDERRREQGQKMPLIRKAKEPPKATLATLNASFGKT